MSPGSGPLLTHAMSLVSPANHPPSDMSTSAESTTPPSHLTLFSLSDELLLNIVRYLDRHTDIPSTRLTCRKLNGLTETYFFRNVMISLPEELLEPQWQMKLRLFPPQISKTKHFTVLNQRRPPGGFFYNNTICRRGSYRILRWNLLEATAAQADGEFSKAACLAGVQFYPKQGKFAKRQLTAFRWRHAIPLSLPNLTAILERQASTLQELEISMIRPPVAEGLSQYRSAVKHKAFPSMRSFKYHGLSHTEPLAVNRPEKGGRFRMLRPLFQKFHSTLQELVLSQDHCISQVGRTPMTLGRTIFDTLCRLDDLYIDTSKSKPDESPPITLKLTNLELGGFNVANLFDTPSDSSGPRVRVDLPAIRRLVLNNCYAADSLLRKLHARKDEIHIKEFAIRVGEEIETADEHKVLYEALRDFLLCFRGLEVLSVLIEGTSKGLRVGKDVLLQHSKTLQAYSVASRNLDDGDDELNSLRFVAIPTDGVLNKDEISPGCLGTPPRLREYGTFLNKVLGSEYPRLRYLSQFPDLRTVVIRNFPDLPTGLSKLSSVLRHKYFWRDGEDHTSDSVKQVVETFAEQIALPFYALPDQYKTEDLPPVDDSLPFPGGFYKDDLDYDLEHEDERIKSELKGIAEKHAAVRDGKLGFVLQPFPQSPTPKPNPTRDIMKQKASVDSRFEDVMYKVKQGTASTYEREAYDNYEKLVRTVIGIDRPPVDSKPKLRLLVIGDWTYRDQMNITGPRRWDPAVWSHGSDMSEVQDSDGEGYSDSNGDAFRWNHTNYRLKQDFKKEFDVDLLPIFFSIDWKLKHDDKKGRWKWAAVATKMEQNSTMEGQGMLGDTKLLDFAWNI